MCKFTNRYSFYSAFMYVVLFMNFICVFISVCQIEGYIMASTPSNKQPINFRGVSYTAWTLTMRILDLLTSTLVSWQYSLLIVAEHTKKEMMQGLHLLSKTTFCVFPIHLIHNKCDRTVWAGNENYRELFVSIWRFFH